MRQRVKLAQALAHDPQVLLLDEPLNGLDPAQRLHVVELVKRLGEEGRTVLVSSHVLHEVERMAPRVLVLVDGRLVARGTTAGIRELIADRPRTFRLRADRVRALASDLLRADLVDTVHLDGDELLVEVSDVERFTIGVTGTARDAGVRLAGLEPVGTTWRASTATCTSAPRGAPVIVDRTVFGILFRGLVGGRRALVLAVVALLPVIAAIAHTTGDVDPDVYWARLVQRLLIPVVTAFVAAVVGAGAIADEREDGTILYLASTPLRG